MAIDSRAVLIATLEIPSGATKSTLDGAGSETFVGSEMQGFESIALVSDPANTVVGTITIMVLADPTADHTVVANYVTLQSPPATDVVLAEDKAIVLTNLPFPALIFRSGGTEDSILIFRVFGARNK